MNVRRLRPVPVVVIALLLLGCTPNPEGPGTDPSSPHPADHTLETDSPPMNDGYDY